MSDGGDSPSGGGSVYEFIMHGLSGMVASLSEVRDGLIGREIEMLCMVLKSGEIQTGDELEKAAAEVNTALQRYETVLRRTSEILEAKINADD